jgi:hypothetical protein
MTTVTVTIRLDAALNIKTLIQDRMKQILELQEQYPELPMKDPVTWESYRDALYQLDRETDRVQQVAQQ